MNRGFTLIEVLLVIVVIAVLAGMAITFYHYYLPKAIKISLVSDLRNCLTEIIATKQNNPNHPISEVVENCPKSRFTQEIRILSEIPLILGATSTVGNASCSYDDSSGAVFCNF